MSKEKSSRTRNYATIVYPESAPANWIDVLREHKIPCLISPLHDKDNTAVGEQKKPHYHVIILFDSVKTEEQAREVFSSFGGCGCEVVKSMRGYARYLCHLDNADKAQYAISDVQSYFGVDYDNLIACASDRYATLRDIMQFIDDNKLRSFAHLLRYCRDTEPEWFKLLCDSGAYIIKEYIKSCFWEDTL